VQAISDLRKVVDGASEDIALRTQLAVMLRTRRHLDAAIAEFREALKLDSESGASHYNLAMTLIDQADQSRKAKKAAALREACQLLVAGSQLAPSDPDFTAEIKHVGELMPKLQNCSKALPRNKRRVARP
jgi:Flp pilus assembly protein TadD